MKVIAYCFRTFDHTKIGNTARQASVGLCIPFKTAQATSRNLSRPVRFGKSQDMPEIAFSRRMKC